MSMEGKYIRRLRQLVVYDNMLEQTNTFQYLGCNISMYRVNMEFEGNVSNCNNFSKNMRKEVKLKCITLLRNQPYSRVAKRGD
jgi:hypothetical protein